MVHQPHQVTSPKLAHAGLWAVTHAAWFRHSVTALILILAIVVGLETYPTLVERFGALLRSVDTAIIALFTIEIVLRIAAEGRKPWRFFHSGWNVFDFVIVAVCLIPASGGAFAVVRLARVLRVLRLLSAIPRLQVLIGALLHSLPSIGYVGLLLGLLFYVYGVVGAMLFGANDPGHFGTLDRALLSLFRAVTLEDWTDLMYTQIHGSALYPPQISGVVADLPPPESTPRPLAAIAYFVSFVLIGTMIVLNLFIGVVLSSMNEAQAEQAKSTIDKLQGGTDLTARMRTLEAQTGELLEELRALRELAERGPPGGP
jgi:voltage-gated sodium channel